MSAIDRLLDFMSQQSVWTTPPTATFTVPQKIQNATEELRIIPGTPNGPMLEIVTSNGHGAELFKQRLNLAAVDDLIGKLIKMRDLMSQIKESPNDTDNKIG